jgi:hypothetical protein
MSEIFAEASDGVSTRSRRSSTKLIRRDALSFLSSLFALPLTGKRAPSLEFKFQEREQAN